MIDACHTHLSDFFILDLLSNFVAESSYAPLRHAIVHLVIIDCDVGTKDSQNCVRQFEIGRQVGQRRSRGAIGLKCEVVCVVGVRVGDDPQHHELLPFLKEREGLLCDLLQSEAVELLDNFVIDNVLRGHTS